ncbi:MAG: DUF1844 domain-containing protein [Candidatus Binataceae bacterium]|nr:DUF1844 domain-containing protein [Candidatus Binataceae bacterium]
MSDQEEKEEKGFKIQDRRRFSAQGDLKPEFTAPTETATTPPAAGNPPSATESPESAGEQYSSATASAKAESLPEITFASFVIGLSTQALVHLGEIPDPMSGQTRRDLPEAQQLIDLIGILQEKTRGNLDSDEASMLQAILFDLRMKYVELADTPSV